MVGEEVLGTLPGLLSTAILVDVAGNVLNKSGKRLVNQRHQPLKLKHHNGSFW